MTEPTVARAKDVFADAVAQPAAKRQAFVARRCGSDVGLLDLVQDLLAYHRPMGTFLRPPLEAVTMDASDLMRATAAPPVIRSSAPSPQEAAPDCGSVIADRYRLEVRLGAGAFGAVFRATDQLSGRPVAVKIMKRPNAASLGVWRREVATLRRTQLPGVVSLLDEGLLDEHSFIVMSLVSGTPFPGIDVVEQSDLEDVCVGVLEALDRLHWAGLIHRDLKPDNVLVGADGRPVIVDLGIAWDSGSDQADRTLLGTPVFIAPELFDGRAATVRSDLYSVGVMMFELFAGRTPHPAGSLADLVTACTSRPAPRLASVAPGVPERIARTVDRLLDRDPARRPATAAETIASLRGDVPSRRSIRDLPYLGDGGAIERLVASASSRRSAHLFGPPGSGRTRTVFDAAQRLVDAGYEVRRTIPGNRALWSLRTVVGTAPPDMDETALAAWAGARLRSLLATGIVVVADDLERIDAGSRELIARERGRGCVLSTSCDAAFDDAESLSTLSESALRALFAGSSRVLQIPEEAAYELWVRTAGYPGRVVDELDAWVRGGLARSEAGRIVIDRAAIERLRLDRTIHALAPLATEQTASSHAELLEAVELCGVPAGTDVIAAAVDAPLAEIATQLTVLEDAHAVERTPDGWILVVRAPRDPTRSTPAQRARVHSRVADGLAVGDPRRLHHLVAAGRLDEIADEASASAEQLLDAGHSSEALAALTLAIAVSRTAPPTERSDLDGVLTLLLRAALLTFSRDSINVLLYHLGRAHERTPVVETVERVARAASQGVHGNAERAMESLRVPAPADQVELEYWRNVVRVVTSQHGGDAALTDALVDLCRWSRQTSDPAARGLLARWLGWRRYRRGRFGGAARLHRRAAQLATTPLVRLISLTDASNAALDGCDYDRALASALKCAALARELRAAMSLARAEWIARSARYRRGDAMNVDHELLVAAEELGVPAVTALIHLNEAAIAWRTGRRALARSLAVRGSELAAGSARESLALLQRSHAVAAGEQMRPGEDEELLARVDRCSVPGLAAQSAGLLAAGGHRARTALDEIARRNAEQLPAVLFDVRREILSIAESLEFTKSMEGRC